MLILGTLGIGADEDLRLASAFSTCYCNPLNAQRDFAATWASAQAERAYTHIRVSKIYGLFWEPIYFGS